jgi:Sec-independent protein translocase protein TatA
VGYFVLGPSDLYKIVKEVGKFIQNIRTFSTDLTTTFESNMESQLQLQDIRKAQQELNDAFSFRRSINVNEEADAFSNETVETVAPPASAAASSSQIASKKIRRRVKKRVPPPATVPDLEMPSPTEDASLSALEAAEIEKEFEKYTSDVTDDYIRPKATAEKADAWNSEPDAGATSRFQQQLSGTWNEQILENEDKLSPIATVMNKIALLEKEKKAAILRLEEEFAQRKALEDRYYQEQRALLEEASFQIQDELILGPKSGKA